MLKDFTMKIKIKFSGVLNLNFMDTDHLKLLTFAIIHISSSSSSVTDLSEFLIVYCICGILFFHWELSCAFGHRIQAN